MARSRISQKLGIVWLNLTDPRLPPFERLNQQVPQQSEPPFGIGPRFPSQMDFVQLDAGVRQPCQAGAMDRHNQRFMVSGSPTAIVSPPSTFVSRLDTCACITGMTVLVSLKSATPAHPIRWCRRMAGRTIRIRPESPRRAGSGFAPPAASRIVHGRVPGVGT